MRRREREQRMDPRKRKRYRDRDRSKGTRESLRESIVPGELEGRLATSQLLGTRGVLARYLLARVNRISLREAASRQWRSLLRHDSPQMDGKVQRNSELQVIRDRAIVVLSFAYLHFFIKG